MHPLLAGLCMIGSAALYGLPFAPAGYQGLAWAVLVPVLVAMRLSSGWTAVWVAWGFAVGGAYAVAEGLPGSISDYYGQPRLLGILFLVALASITTSSVMIVFAFYYRGIVRLDARLPPLAAGVGWVAYELVRARVLGNPWAGLGYSQVGIGPLMQIADVTGVYGLGFTLASVNAAVVEIVLARDRRSLRPAVAAAGLVGACVCGQLLYGWMRPHGVLAAIDSPTSRVAVIQGNIDLGSQWREEFYGRNLGVYLSLTSLALRENGPSLVVWPENAMTFFVEREPIYGAAIASVLSVTGAQLISGGPRAPGTMPNTYFNSAFLIDVNGAPVSHYDKRQLLPFAEYFPVPWLDFLRRSFGRIREFAPGGQTPPLATVAGAAGVMICNESLFGEIASRRVAAGAELLVNLTNDGWLSDRGLSGIAFDMTTLRAVEQRRYLVRASTSGPSAVIDPLGRVHGRTGQFSRDTTAGEVRTVRMRTLYSRVGDLFGVVCLMIAAVVALRTRPG